MKASKTFKQHVNYTVQHFVDHLNLTAEDYGLDLTNPEDATEWEEMQNGCMNKFTRKEIRSAITNYLGSVGVNSILELINFNEDKQDELEEIAYAVWDDINEVALFK